MAHEPSVGGVVSENTEQRGQAGASPHSPQESIRLAPRRLRKRSTVRPAADFPPARSAGAADGASVSRSQLLPQIGDLYLGEGPLIVAPPQREEMVYALSG